MADPTGRVSVAFDQPTLLWDCTWTRLDDDDNLVTSYSIDRGRQYELDRTDTGRATVQIADREGVLDPTNPSGPYYTKIEPLLQIALGRRNPVTGEWHTRFRGFIEDYNYGVDPGQQVNRLELTCVDLFEILAAIQMVPAHLTDPPSFGDDWHTVAPDAEGQIVFANESMQSRIVGVLGNAGIPDDWRVVFTGNVELATSTYAPTENVMTVIQEATDAEFPAVSNAYCERNGRLAVHGRGAKFDPAAVAASAGDAAWDWHHWHAGDGAAVNAGSGVAHIREFAYNRGLSKIINQAYASPAYILVDGEQIQTEGNDWARSDHAGSQAKYGIRSWSAENLLTLRGWADDTFIIDSVSVDEVARYTAYYMANYHEPKNRVTVCGFKTMHPDAAHSGATWALLSQIEISDLIGITVATPGGGGFIDEDFFVEGIHEQVTPLEPGYDNVNLTLDLSPRAYFDDLSMFD